MNFILRILIIYLVIFSSLAAKENLEKISLQLKWKYQFQFAGFIAAKEKGFYRDVGLDVELLEYKHDTDTLKALQEKKIQFGVSDSALILEAVKGTPVVSMLGIYQESPYILMSLKSSNIKKLKDIEGKKVAIYDDINGKAIESLLKLNHINFVKEPIKNKLQRLQNKEIDVAISYISNEPFLAKAMGMEVNIIKPKDYGYERYGDILFTSQELLENNPELVKKMYQATKKGFEYAFTNIDELVNIIHKKYNTFNKSKTALQNEAKILKQMAHLDKGFGKLEQAKIESIAYIYSYSGLIKYNSKNLSNFIYKTEDSKNLQLTSLEQEYLDNKPYLTVASLKAFHPFSFVENDQPMGYSVDYMKLIGKYLDKEIKFVHDKSWNQILEMMKNGKVDINPHIAITKERKKFIEYTNFNHIKHTLGVAIRKDQNYDSIDSLKAQTIAVNKKTFLHTYLKNNYPDINLYLTKNTHDAVLAVSNNKADAVIGSFPSINYYIQSKWLNNLKTITINDLDLPKTANLPMGVAKGNTILKSILEKVNNAIPKSEKQQLKEKWLNIDKNALSAKEKEFIKNHQEIRFRTRSDRPPFEFVENGEVKGIAVDYIKLITKSMGIKAKFIIDNRPTKDAYEEIEGQREKFDTLNFSVKNKENAQRFSFGNSFLSYPMMIITNKNSGYVGSLSDLNNKTVALEEGFITNKWIKRDYPKIIIVPVKNTIDALTKLNDGKVDAYVGNMAVANYMSIYNELTNLKVSAPSDYDNVKYSFMAPKDWPELASILSKGYDNITPDEHSAIQQKWFSFQTIETINYKLVWQIVVGSTFIILWILWWNRKIHTEKEKTNIANKKLAEYIQIVDQNVITSSTDLDGNIIHVSHAFCDISGYTKDELIGRNHNIICHPDMNEKVYENLWKTIKNDDIWSGEIKNKKKCGDDYWVEATITPTFNEQGKKIGYTAIRQDITDKKIIENISITDGLTDIFNRRHFNEVFPRYINSAKRKDELVSFLIMDIDYFKQYNDTYGHQMGDEVLIKVAQTIKKSLHRADDYCFRLGGEEFGAIYKSNSKEQALSIAKQIKDNLENLHIKHEKSKVSKFITTSMGLVSMNAREIQDNNLIYKEADILLYEAKKSGRNKVVSNYSQI